MKTQDEYMEMMSPKTDKEENISTQKGVIGLILKNFFIWLIPGSIILAIAFIVILILASASATTGGTADVYKRMPKGLVSFFGIGFALLGLALIILIFSFPEMDAESIIIFIAVALVSFILSYDALKKEIKRLSKMAIAKTA